MPRKRAATQAFQARLQKATKEALDQAAARNGRSVNAELAARLDASFAAEDDAGGPRLAALTQLWSLTFQRGGRLGARAMGHPDWTGDEWIDDPIAYRTAYTAADDVLRKHTPRLADEEERKVSPFLWELAERLARGETLKDIVAAWQAQQAAAEQQDERERDV